MQVRSEMHANHVYQQALKYDAASDFHRALELRKALLEYLPNEPKFILSLADSFNQLGMRDQAQVQYIKAIEIHPRHEFVSLSYFYFLWQAERTEDALSEMARFQSNSNSQEYLQIAMQIESAGLVPSR